MFSFRLRLDYPVHLFSFKFSYEISGCIYLYFLPMTQGPRVKFIAIRAMFFDTGKKSNYIPDTERIFFACRPNSIL
jgi:hypothetical protein